MSIPKLELPGLRGEVRIPYDLTTGTVSVEARALAYPQLVQLLLAATAATVNEWIQQDARLIKPKPKGADDGSEKGNPTNNDDNG